MVQGKKEKPAGKVEKQQPPRIQEAPIVNEFTGQEAAAKQKKERKGVVRQSSAILEEGKKAEENTSAFTKAFYTTWNSIPWAHSPSIAVELWKTIFKQGSFGGQKEALKLEPNYKELNFTPLENSFTRRANGFGNWMADVFGGKPYRILSDMGEDGVLYSPKGGSLEEVFPVTIMRIVNDPLAMGILKEERIGQLEELVNAYEEKYGKLGEMETPELFEALKEVGDENSVMFYRQGFRDSQVYFIEKMLRGVVLNSGLTAKEKGRIIGLIEGRYTKFDIRVANRGYGREGLENAGTDFVDMKYDLPELEIMLGDEAAYKKLSGAERAELGHLVKMREELVQEAHATIAPVEFCRRTFYNISAELGSKLAEEGKLAKADDVHFLTVQELGNVIGGAEVDQALIEKRRKAAGY